MLNNAWPSMLWHLYDWYLHPAGAYFGAKKANERLHVQYSYDDRSIVVVNHGPRAATGLTVRAELFELDGTRSWTETRRSVRVESGGVRRTLTVPAQPEAPRTYFVRLSAAGRDGKTVSRNTYWLSALPDVLDWETKDGTFAARFADMTALATLPKAAISVSAASDGGNTTVALQNTSKTIAPAVRVTLREPDGSPVLPVIWSDNYVALWPGEKITLRATHEPSRGALAVEVGGWNAAPRTARTS